MRGTEYLDLYNQLAKEIKADGYRTFLFKDDFDAWLYIISPDNSWLTVQPNCYHGLDVTYEYVPSRDFGSGCCYNEEPLHKVTTETLKQAELYGKHFGHRGWIQVPNIYDGRCHRENVWRSPNHYKDGYKAMTESYFGNRLIEL